MSDLTRRNWLRYSAAGTLVPWPDEAASRTAAIPAQKASQTASLFTRAELETLVTLCNLIIPSDEHSAGADAANAPQYIGLLAANNPKIGLIFRGGLAWLDAASLRLYGTPFTATRNQDQTALLDKIAYNDRVTREYHVGAIFFDWARRLTVDAYYTSKVGIADLGYRGNTGSSEFVVPTEVLEQAHERFKFLETE